MEPGMARTSSPKTFVPSLREQRTENVLPASFTPSTLSYSGVLYW